MQRLYWFRLIDALKTNGLIDIGATIPYLIGARKHKDPSFALIPNDIQTLLGEMANSDSGDVGIIQFCDTIQQVVIGVGSKETVERQYNTAISVKNKQGVISLISLLDTKKYGDTIADVSKTLMNVYWPPIKNRTYSWDYLFEEWGPIFKKELNIIEQVDI